MYYSMCLYAFPVTNTFFPFSATSTTYTLVQLIDGIKSGVVDLGKHTASLLCAVAVYVHDVKSLEYLLSATFTDKQANNICIPAASCFKYDEHREVSKQIMIHMVKEHCTDFQAMESDFFKKHF